METRYDPATDLTDYSETFRATCPLCGVEQSAGVAFRGVPRDDIAPAFIPSLDAKVAEELARARERFLAAPEPCGLCSPPAGDDQANIHLLT